MDYCSVFINVLFFFKLYFWVLLSLLDKTNQAERGTRLEKDHKPGLEIGSPETLLRCLSERCPQGYGSEMINYFICVLKMLTGSLRNSGANCKSVIMVK